MLSRHKQVYAFANIFAPNAETIGLWVSLAMARALD